jgi:hypothetical protein
MSDTNKLQPQSNDKVVNEVGAPSTEKKGEGEKKKLPQLGALEDDDEFEVCSPCLPSFPRPGNADIQDFPAAGKPI